MAHGSYSQNPLWGSLVRVIRDILVWEFKDRVVVMSWVSPLVWVRPLHLRIRRTPGVWQIMARDSNDKLFSYKKPPVFQMIGLFWYKKVLKKHLAQRNYKATKQKVVIIWKTGGVCKKTTAYFLKKEKKTHMCTESQANGVWMHLKTFGRKVQFKITISFCCAII